ncbi:MAG TPA: DUF308 domain-containing protein [Acetobacteraceae bacterium]|nr:DUF308 domain-containing protein [Acetobacteraceae bacterium]
MALLVTDPGEAGLRRAIHDHSGLVLAEGIILVLLGIGAILIPPLAGLATTIFLGWLFLIAGVAGLVSTLRGRALPGFGWSLLSAVAALLAGLVLIWHPLAGLATLTTVLTAFFVVDGIFMVVLAISHRGELTGRWEWLLVNGLVDLLLAALIIAGLPGSLVWVLGVFVGLDLLFGGGALIAMALEARR